MTKPGSGARVWDYGSSERVPSPFPRERDTPPRYLAFDRDIGAFNNIWMNLEVTALLAWLTGRTLVLPPAWRVHLLGESPSSLLDFIDRRALERSVDVVTAEELVERTGFDLDPTDAEAFNAGLERIGTTQAWNSDEDALLIPGGALTNRFELIPRLLRRRAVSLEGPAESAELLYIPSSERCRILGPFETFLLFGDASLERRARRFSRDALRYHPHILDLAEQILRAAGLEDEPYSSMHIRRGDFQYLETRIDASSAVDYTAALLEAGETVYVATDEMDPAFVAPLRKRYRVVTWRDLPKDLTNSVPPRWVGILETLILAAATGRFFGTRLSTFSVRASVIRGHLSRNSSGLRAGVDTTLYYTQPPLGREAPALAEAVTAKKETAEPWWESVAHTPLWGRAYPSTWTDVE